MLNSQELEVLTILWEAGPQKPADIQRQLSFEVKNSALRWQLGDMVQRGILRREALGKAFVYSAVSGRREVFGSFARRLKQMFFGGSALAMIGEMLETGELSSQELQSLISLSRKKSSGQSERKA